MRLLPVMLLAAAIAPLHAAQAYEVTIDFSNLSGANGAALSPVFIALQNGSFNPYTPGSTASSAIVTLAHTGSGSGLGAEFNQPGGQSAEVTASGGFGPGIYLPGQSGSITLNLDPVANEYLSFYTMVVPSNDRFIGETVQLFNSSGTFIGANETLNGSSIWEAGAYNSQVAGAAFVVNNAGNNVLTPNGVISQDYNFSVYSGQLTPAGYNFTNLPGADTPILSLSATAAAPVPLPAQVVPYSIGLGLLGLKRLAGQRNKNRDHGLTA